MWWSFRFLRLSAAEKTHNQVFRVLTFSTGTRLVKIAIFSPKILGLPFCLKSSHRLIWGRNRCGEVSDSSGCMLLRKPIIKFLGFCNFCQVRAEWKSLCIHQKLLVFDFVWNRLTDWNLGRNRCGEVSDSSGCLLLRKPIINFLGFWRSRQVRAEWKSLFFH